MSAVLADGRTTIRNAAAEPEVDNLIDFLNALGGRVRRLETDVHTIEIDGVARGSLHGAHIDVIPDWVEAGSFAMAAAVTGGELFLEGARADHLGAFLDACRKTGIDIACEPGGIRVGGKPPFREHRVSTEIYPGFPTDLQAPFALALVEADAVSTIKENLYEDRFDYATALQQMCASIHVFHPHTAAFYGPSPLHGSEVEIPDLRAGATLILAALAANGESRLTGIEHVARGPEKPEGRTATARR